MKKYVLLFLILCAYSCKKEKSQNDISTQKPQLSIVQKHDAVVQLQFETKKELGVWKEYTTLEEFLKQYTIISANEALNNALELAQLTKVLKDSIRPEVLVNPAFKTRVNVLENEALRLKDMTYISAITANEVNNQVSKILAAFSATNSKINTVYSQIALEKELKINDTTINLKNPKPKEKINTRKSLKEDKKI